VKLVRDTLLGAIVVAVCAGVVGGVAWALVDQLLGSKRSWSGDALVGVLVATGVTLVVSIAAHYRLHRA
jgi:hypothetical protein